MRRLSRLLAAALVPALLSQAAAAEFDKGADLSLVDFIQDHGVVYREDGKPKDPLLIFKDHGCNYVRLRLFLSPSGKEGQVDTLSYTLRLAKKVKARGLGFLLDLHYSDGWADPGHQTMPAEWVGLTHEKLLERVSAYTRETLAAFRREGCSPDIVEVGNEITNGMLWPDAGPMVDPATWNDSKNPKPADESKWDRLADVLKAGIKAVHDDDAGGTIRIMIHIDKGGSAEGSRWFFDHLHTRDVAFDLIGLSYYPFWHGSLDDLRANLASLSSAYGKDIIVVETAYETWGGDQKTLPYPITPKGQKKFLDELMRIVAATPGGHGRGVFYWGGEWIMGKQWTDVPWTGQVEDRSLFDHSGNVLPAIASFGYHP
jgi:arabinogalactan endo-1,4-beta-galactosidase